MLTTFQAEMDTSRMRKRTLSFVVAAASAAMALAACGPINPPTPTKSPTPTITISPLSPSPSASPTAKPSPIPSSDLHKVHDPGNVTGILNGPCHVVNGDRPDASCTPGAYDPAITAAILCAPDHRTSSYRASEYQTNKFKWNVAEPAYGQVEVKGELDHLVPLELGGANDASNLWVEPGTIPNPKDHIENVLHDWVCSVDGVLAQHRLSQAQIDVAVNWTTAESKLGIR